jgi:hypothetical protein
MRVTESMCGATPSTTVMTIDAAADRVDFATQGIGTASGSSRIVRLGSHDDFQP